MLTSRHGEVPPELAAVVRRCLEKDADNRFADVALFAAALAPLGSEAAAVSATCIARVLEASSATGVSMRPPPSAEAQATPSETGIRERARGGVARRLGGVAVLLALGAGVGWMVLKHDSVPRDPSSPAIVAVASAVPAPPAPMVPPPIVPVAAVGCEDSAGGAASACARAHARRADDGCAGPGPRIERAADAFDAHGVAAARETRHRHTVRSRDPPRRPRRRPHSKSRPVRTIRIRACGWSPAHGQ